MPQNCGECALYIDGACYGKGYRDYRSIMDTAKPDDCPLIELPPHGRLIDADKLKSKFRHGEGNSDVDSAWISTIRRFITQADTIIEAEGETK